MIAWSLSIGSALYLFKRNRSYDRWNSAFIVSFSTIQLLEAGLWQNFYRHGDAAGSVNKANRLITKLILLTLSAQPLVQSYMGWKATKEFLLKLFVWVFGTILLYNFYRVTFTNEKFESRVGEGGHLVWESGNGGVFLGSKLIGILYLTGLFFPLLYQKEPSFIPGLSKGFVLAIIGAITAAYAYVKAGAKEFSSNWCFIAVIYSLAAIVV